MASRDITDTAAAPGRPAARSNSAEFVGRPGPVAAWTAVFVLALLYGLAFVDRQIISLLVAPIRHDLNISDSQIGLLQGFSFALLYSIGGLPLGFAADRLPRRWVIFGGVFVWALAATACGLVHGFGALLACRVLVGVGEAALAPAAYSILSDMFPPQRLTFALSFYAVGALAGSSTSLFVGAAATHWFANGLTLPIFGHLHAWQAAFVATGAPGLLIAFSIFAIPEPPRGLGHAQDQSSWADMFRFMRSRGAFFTCQIIGFACILTLAYAQLYWGPSFLMRTYGWPVTEVGLVLAIFSFITGAVSMLFSGRVVDALQRRGMKDAHFRFYAVGTVILIFAGAGAYWAPQPWMFFALASLAAITMNMAAVGASAIQLVTPPALRGRVSAFYLAVCSLIAMTFGPQTVAFFTDTVFHNDAAIRASMSCTFLLYAPIALAAFVLGLKPMRDAVTRAGGR
jgi:MFS family permease